jgi:ADP-ribose pyrophosphatase YjhB (NUDIX family)
MKATLVVSAAVIDNGKLLLVQEGKEHCRGQWSLPGGRVEEGESLVDAVMREVLEETGYNVRVAGVTPVLRYVSQYGFHCVRFNFVAGIVGGTTSFDGSEILDVRWLAFDDIDVLADAELRTPTIARQVIGHVRSNAIYPLDIFLDALGDPNLIHRQNQ